MDVVRPAGNIRTPSVSVTRASRPPVPQLTVTDVTTACCTAAGARSRTDIEYDGKLRLKLPPATFNAGLVWARLEWPSFVWLWAVSWVLPYCQSVGALAGLK